MILEVIDALAANGLKGDPAVEQKVSAEIQDVCRRLPIYG